MWFCISYDKKKPVVYFCYVIYNASVTVSSDTIQLFATLRMRMCPFQYCSDYFQNNFCKIMLELDYQCNQWRSQGLPGWATRPSGRPNWGRKWRKIEEKCEKIEEKWGKMEEMFLSCPPGSERLATALSVILYLVLFLFVCFLFCFVFVFCYVFSFSFLFIRLFFVTMVTNQISFSFLLVFLRTWVSYVFYVFCKVALIWLVTHCIIYNGVCTMYPERIDFKRFNVNLRWSLRYNILQTEESTRITSIYTIIYIIKFNYVAYKSSAPK